MLETTFKNSFDPGTNLIGGLADDYWRFLLPSLQLERVLCLEVPSASTLKVLSRHAQDITVVTMQPRYLNGKTDALPWSNVPNVRLISLPDYAELPVPSASMSLIFLANDTAIKTLHTPEVIAELRRVQKPEGAIYFECWSLLDGLMNGGIVKSLERLDQASVQQFRLLQRTAFPAHDHGLSYFLFRNILYGQSFKKRLLSRAGMLVSRMGISATAASQGILIRASHGSRRLYQAPDYLIDLATKSGIDLTQFRCGLSARGRYNANKTVFHLFNQKLDQVELIVKMTRTPEFNHRLENEHRALTCLAENSPVEVSTFPQRKFFGYHAGLAIIGQSAVQGRPFRSCKFTTVDTPLLRQVIAWLTRLARSSNSVWISGHEAAETMLELYERFNQIYDLSSHERIFLHDQVMAFQEAGRMPLVFQHGDPGTWNMLVKEDGEVVVIDWEAAETQGLPLWDLFYFLRSYGNWLARLKGHRDHLKNFSHTFFEPSLLGSLQAEAVDRYREAISLPQALIEPLFYTCWMHRSLKEAMRREAHELQGGNYIRLLKLCIQRRNAAGLLHLFQSQPVHSVHSLGLEKNPSLRLAESNHLKIVV